MKTANLTGAALDWAVAKCDDRRIRFNLGGGLEVRARTEEGDELPTTWDLWMPWHPSTDWAQGGPIIEREQVAVKFWVSEDSWEACIKGGFFASYGPTPLIAAMRCYCCSKLGDEVEIPKELTGD